MHLLLDLVLHEKDLNSSVKQEQEVWAWFDTHEEHQRDFKEFTPSKEPYKDWSLHLQKSTLVKGFFHWQKSIQ